MGQRSESQIAAAEPAPVNGIDGLAGDLLWGVANIAKEINRTKRQTFHLLAKGCLPARKFGGRYCASRAGLRHYFANLIAGEAAER